MGPIRSPSGESARHEDAQKRLISATAAAQKRRVRGLAYESPAALRGWRSGEQAGTCSAVLGAAGESRERGRGWPPRAAKAKYRTIFSTGEATRRSNGPGQPREAAPRKSRKPRNGWSTIAGNEQRTWCGNYVQVISLVERAPRPIVSPVVCSWSFRCAACLPLLSFFLFCWYDLHA